MPPIYGKIVFSETGPWCLKGWGMLLYIEKKPLLPSLLPLSSPPPFLFPFSFSLSPLLPHSVSLSVFLQKGQVSEIWGDANHIVGTNAIRLALHCVWWTGGMTLLRCSMSTSYAFCSIDLIFPVRTGSLIKQQTHLTSWTILQNGYCLSQLFLCKNIWGINSVSCFWGFLLVGFQNPHSSVWSYTLYSSLLQTNQIYCCFLRVQNFSFNKSGILAIKWLYRKKETWLQNSCDTPRQRDERIWSLSAKSNICAILDSVFIDWFLFPLYVYW